MNIQPVSMYAQTSYNSTNFQAKQDYFTPLIGMDVLPQVSKCKETVNNKNAKVTLVGMVRQELPKLYNYFKHEAGNGNYTVMNLDGDLVAIENIAGKEIMHRVKRSGNLSVDSNALIKQVREDHITAKSAFKPSGMEKKIPA